MFRTTWRAALVVTSVAAIVAVLMVVTAPPPAQAHGTNQAPPSRTYVCRFLLPDAPPCRDAWAANPQALYDWMEVNLGTVAGNHQQYIPDGHLCSAGRAKYEAFDAARTDWPATPVQAGPTTVSYTSITAPHATAYFRYYLTRDGFDPTRPLRWSDLDLVYDSGPRPAATGYTFPVTLPDRSGRHIMYVVWQRSDSPEAFYSCSDVTYEPGAPTLPTVGRPDTPPPPPPVEPAVPDVEVPVTLTVSSDWGSGYCVDAVATNPTATSVAWFGHLTFTDTLTNSWNATVSAHGGAAHAIGQPWNRILAPGASTSFGFCADRTATPPPTTTSTTRPPSTTTSTTRPPSTTSTTRPPSTTTTTRPPTSTTTPKNPTAVGTSLVRTIDTDWGAGYCATVVVRNTTAAPLFWRASVKATGTLASLWNATGSIVNGRLQVRGASWNAVIPALGSTSFGYCITR